MDNEIITCFNGKECSYKECTLFSEELDSCKLELLKGTRAPVAPQRTAPTPPAEEEIQPGGQRFINTLKSGDISSKDNKINIKGTLVYDPEQNERNTRDGPKNVVNFTIDDGTGQLKLGVWGDDGDQFMEFKKDDKLFIENVYKIKDPYDDVLQADLGKYFKVVKVN